MAKRKKAKGKKRSRRRGMGAMPKGSAMQKGLLLLTTIAASNLADEGMEMLYGLDFMQATPGTDGKTPKINVKKAGASGGALVGSGALAVMSKNDWISAAATGVAVTASKYLKDDLVKPVLGMGEVSDFLNLYKKDMKGVQLAGDKDPVQLAGDEIKIS